MIHQFDHRFATYREERRAGSEWRVETADVGDTEKADPTYQVLPRYWVPEEEVESAPAGQRLGPRLAPRLAEHRPFRPTSAPSLRR